MRCEKAASVATDMHTHEVLVDAPVVDEMIKDLKDARNCISEPFISVDGYVGLVLHALETIKASDEAKVAKHGSGILDEAVPVFVDLKDIELMLSELDTAITTVAGGNGVLGMLHLYALGEMLDCLRSKADAPHISSKMKAARLRLQASEAIVNGEKLRGLQLHLKAYFIDGYLAIDLVEPARGTDPEGDAVERLMKRDAASSRRRRA